MSTFTWILVSGLAMSLLALVGSVTLVLPERTFRRVVLPLVALAAGSLLGGSLFHMLPQSVAVLDNSLAIYGYVAVGIVVFLILEQYLHWHHCHRASHEHEHVGYLVLVADGLHNLIGGLAVGSAFVLDIRLGIVTWLIAAAHEIPQELGDFGLLVHSCWSRRSALLYNLGSASSFLLGSLIAYALSGQFDVTLLVAFAAGNFIYIAMADLIPQLTSQERLRHKIVHTLTFTGGLGALYVIAATLA